MPVAIYYHFLSITCSLRNTKDDLRHAEDNHEQELEKIKASLSKSERTSEERRKCNEKMEVKFRDYLQSKTTAKDPSNQIRDLEKQLSEADKQMRREQTRNKETINRLHRELDDANDVLTNCKFALSEANTRLEEYKEKAKKEVNMKQAQCVEFQSQLFQLQKQNEDIKRHYERELLEVSEKLQHLCTEMKLGGDQQIRELREQLQKVEQR